MDDAEVSRAGNRSLRPGRVDPRERDPVGRQPQHRLAFCIHDLRLDSVTAPLEWAEPVVEHLVDRPGCDDEIRREFTVVREDGRCEPVRLDPLSGDAISNHDVLEESVEQRIEPARRVVVRRLAREPVLPVLGYLLETSQLPPHCRHGFEPTTPELFVETLERQLGQCRTDGRHQVVAQITFSRGSAGCPDLRQLLLDLSAAWQPPQALEIYREWDYRVLRPQSGSLVDVARFEFDEVANERQGIRSTAKDAHHPGPVFVGSAIGGLKGPQHASGDRSLLEDRHIRVDALAEHPRGARAGEAGPNDDDVHRSASALVWAATTSARP